MCIFDIIKKLENIKHNYLIYALEKYTGQITADDIKKRELERQAQDELAKPEVKKPVEEVKKPVEEVKKFENNIMDSLKWVFISMGILIFLIFVGSLIYWGMYGSNYNEENTMTIENQYIAPPTNQPNQYIAPPTNQSKQYIEPTNVDENEKSIFSFLSPFSKKEETSGIDAVSKTKTQLEADEYLESIKQTNKQSKTKTQLEADEYLESIKQTNTKPQLNDKSNLQSKTKAQLEADEYLESIKQTITKPQLNDKSNLQSKTKAQLDVDEYLESIKQTNTKPQLDTIKINKDDNVQIQKV